MAHSKKARAIGFNHVALEVGDIDEALAFYGRLFEFELRSRSKTSAFVDLGDQFLALQKGRTQPADDGRHLDSWSMTKKPSAAPWPTRVWTRCPASFSTSSIPQDSRGEDLTAEHLSLGYASTHICGTLNDRFPGPYCRNVARLSEWAHFKGNRRTTWYNGGAHEFAVK